MRTAAVVIAAIASSGPLSAQEPIIPKPVPTQTIRQPLPGADTLFSVDADGTVRVDWKTAETLAASKADRIALPIAQLMLAIRDGTWKPMR